MAIILKAARPLGGDSNNSYHTLWMTDFKPSKVRITGTIDGESQACEIRSYASGVGNVIGNFNGANGEVTVDLTYGAGEYFGRIVANGYTSISKIEFNADPGPEPWYEVTWGSNVDGGQHWSGIGWNTETKKWIDDGGSPLGLISSEFNWYPNFRPSQMRVTGTVIYPETAVELYDEFYDVNPTLASASPSSVTTLNITYGALDFRMLDTEAFSEVTKIEVNLPTPAIEMA